MTRPIVVLRPEPGNTATIARVVALGLSPISLPLFDIRAVDWSTPDPRDHDALLVTSANAIRMAGPALAGLRCLPALAVGEATAAAARGAGFEVIAAGTGGVDALSGAAAQHGIARALHLSAAACLHKPAAPGPVHRGPLRLLGSKGHRSGLATLDDRDLVGGHLGLGRSVSDAAAAFSAPRRSRQPPSRPSRSTSCSRACRRVPTTASQRRPSSGRRGFHPGPLRSCRPGRARWSPEASGSSSGREAAPGRGASSPASRGSRQPGRGWWSPRPDRSWRRGRRLGRRGLRLGRRGGHLDRRDRLGGGCRGGRGRGSHRLDGGGGGGDRHGGGCRGGGGRDEGGGLGDVEPADRGPGDGVVGSGRSPASARFRRRRAWAGRRSGPCRYPGAGRWRPRRGGRRSWCRRPW